MRHLVVLLVTCLLVLSLTACAPSSASKASAAYKAYPGKGEPRITFSTNSDELLIDVTSPTGIGSAVIEKTSGQWPAKVVVRLHVKGLESFKFLYPNTVIRVSVSSLGGHAVHETYEAPGQMGEAIAGNPYWIAVTPGDGYFDLQVPADFFKSGVAKFAMEWIDFYR